MKRFLLLLLIVFMLTGCSWNGETYVQVIPRSERPAENFEGNVPAETYEEIRDLLQAMVASGRENDVIYTLNMGTEELEKNMAKACRYVRTEDALGAYALDSVSYEIGTTGGKTAIACSAAYRHSNVEIRKVLHLDNRDQMHKAITEALESCSTGVVMLVNNYRYTDFAQLVQDIARQYPQKIMEIPEVIDEVHGTGSAKVVELSFSYQNSRESLRNMQTQVRPVFDAASLYVSGEGSDFQKYYQLYAFLMERFDYTIETSITPSYSLLRHGVGDSRAFATVYAAMCHNAGLECLVVTGTKNSEPWTWNVIMDNGLYYHIDLLSSASNNYFWEMLDSDMNGYVWDYSAYPECLGYDPEQVPEETAEE